jgi:transcriptional regulator with XRE-family HTH domain
MELNDGKEGRRVFGAMINRLRKERGMTLRELEERSGVMETTICKVEKGVFNTGADTLYKLAEALDAEFALETKE